MYCRQCGAKNEDNVPFCSNCGSRLNENVTTNNNNVNNNNNIPVEYQPISMWGYFGYQLLFSIPCIGFIFLLVYAFGGTTNINLKNYARSYFCFLIIGALLFILIMLLGAGTYFIKTY